MKLFLKIYLFIYTVKLQEIPVDTTKTLAKIAKITDEDFRDAVTALVGPYEDSLNDELLEVEEADVVVE